MFRWSSPRTPRLWAAALARARGPRAGPTARAFASAPPPRRRRRLAVAAGVVGAVVAYDFAEAHAVSRSMRSVATLIWIAADYKLNFREDRDVAALHERVAGLVYNMLTANGGLYIKLGQAIAMQSFVLPPAFQRKFATLYDQAPRDDWPAVEAVLRAELGAAPETVFAWIDHEPVASASIAQVHRAQLHTGEQVAVKVQHPAIRKQVGWDLGAYRAMVYIYDRWVFDIPLYFTVDYTCRRLESELDFENEASNAEAMAAAVASEPALADRVHVPAVYRALTTPRVLTLEWIDGVSLAEPQAVRAAGFDAPWIARTLDDLLGAQVFSWGLVHCDPHPGNILLRRVGRKRQLVLLDHGLYIHMPPAFREQYCLLWRRMLEFDDAGVREIVRSWGVGQSDLFASAVMLRAYRPAAAEPDDDTAAGRFRRQERLKQAFTSFIEDSTKMPLELIFLGRTMRIIQALNKQLGSPVNRIKILAGWASSSLVRTPTSWRGRLAAWTRHLRFLAVVGLSDLGFWLARLRQLLTSSGGFEDVLEAGLRTAARDNLGIEVRDVLDS
ncbi:ABC1 family-domain-containing protein [Dipodascopsis tothii]|uniref:ABC1 family-domain-containing protein n=1 Tax=Dipodascopsis tothii TaxID=44089 RepID=UPI0034D001A0